MKEITRLASYPQTSSLNQPVMHQKIGRGTGSPNIKLIVIHKTFLDVLSAV